MRLALVQDQLLTQGGSERVFLQMCRAFPRADIYTLAYSPSRTLPEFRDLPVRTSWMNPVVPSHDVFRTAFPLARGVMERWDLRDYDVILTSSASTAKYVRRHRALHICYCYFPTRAIWTSEQYFGTTSLGIRGRIFRAFLPSFQRRDLAAAARVDHFIGISKVSAEAIGRIYGKEAEVLHAPIDAERFKPGAEETRGEHFLLVSRLERWKRLDYAIEACTRMDIPLRVVGQGLDEARLRSLAGPTVQFVGPVGDDQLVREYGRARAVIFTPELEYGLVPLEANAAGTPVIALGRGAMPEIMVDAVGGSDAPTAVFFQEQSPEAVMDALARFENIRFDPMALIAHARRFDIPAFREGLRRMVEEYASRLSCSAD